MRRHRISPTAVIACLALFFSLTGAGIAATGYRVTSLWQISPRVRKALRGDRGLRGPRGPAGPVGPQGPTGPSASGVASAGGGEPETLMLAEAAAVQYWGGWPCGGHVAITWVPADEMPSADTGGVDIPGVWGVATFDTPGYSDAYSAPPSDYTDCLMTLNSSVWGSVPIQVDYYADFCALIVHEFGHLFGHPDSASDPPTSITYPIVSTENEYVTPCNVQADVIDSLSLTS